MMAVSELIIVIWVLSRVNCGLAPLKLLFFISLLITLANEPDMPA